MWCATETCADAHGHKDGARQAGRRSSQGQVGLHRATRPLPYGKGRPAGTEPARILLIRCQPCPVTNLQTATVVICKVIKTTVPSLDFQECTGESARRK